MTTEEETTVGRPKRRWEQFVPPVIILLVVLTTWEAAVWLRDIPPWLLPAPSRVFERFLVTDTLWYHTGLTLFEALAGFSASAVIGIALSGAIVHSRFLENGVFPYIIVSNSIPIIAIIPLLTIFMPGEERLQGRQPAECSGGQVFQVGIVGVNATDGAGGAHAEHRQIG